MRHHLHHGLVRHRRGRRLRLDTFQPVDEVLGASLHAHHHLVEALKLSLDAVVVGGAFGELALILVHEPARCAGPRAVQLERIDLLLHLVNLLFERLDPRLAVLGELLEVVVGVLLGHEFGDNLVDVRHARGVLDAKERVLVVIQLTRDGRASALLLAHLGSKLRLFLPSHRRVPRGGVVVPLLPHPRSLRVHLLALPHHLPPVPQVLLPVPPFLVKRVLNLGELRLGLVFARVGLVAEQHELGEVPLLRLDRLVHALQLRVEGDALVAQTLDDLLVRLLDGLRLVVLDESLVEAILELPQQPSRRGVLLGRVHGVVLQVLDAVQLGLELPGLSHGALLVVVVPPAQVFRQLLEAVELLVVLRAEIGNLGLVAIGRRVTALLRELLQEILVLLLRSRDRVLVLLHRPLRRLEVRLAVALCRSTRGGGEERIELASGKLLRAREGRGSGRTVSRETRRGKVWARAGRSPRSANFFCRSASSSSGVMTFGPREALGQPAL